MKKNRQIKEKDIQLSIPRGKEGNWMIDEVKQKGKRGRKAFFNEPTKGVYIKLPIRLIEAIQKANVGGLTKYSAAAIETKAKRDKLV